MLHIGVLLEGGTQCIGAGRCISGSNRDLLCHAVIVLVMIYTVLYAANDTLDALFGAAVALVYFHLIYLLFRCIYNMRRDAIFYTDKTC